MKNKTLFQKIMYFLLEDESILSWVVCLALCFLIIKFIFFPLMGLVFSTSLPFVIVESESMEHNYNSFDSWWDNFHDWYDGNNLTKEQFLKFPLHNGFKKGDIIAVRKMSDYKIGDVIIFDARQEKSVIVNANQTKPIIHRVIEVDNDKNTLSTKGDNNKDQLPTGVENDIPKKKIFGKAIFKVPKLGWVKLFIVQNYNKVKKMVGK